MAAQKCPIEDDIVTDGIVNEFMAAERQAELAHKMLSESWSQSFMKKQLTINALKQLSLEFPSGKATNRITKQFPLREQVLDSCYRATIFKRRIDAAKLNLPKESNARRAITNLHDHIDHLRKHLVDQSTPSTKARREFSALAFRRAISTLEKGSNCITIRSQNPTNYSVLLDLILQAYSAQLDPITNGGLTKGSRKSHIRWGCLSYGKQRSTSYQNPKVETMLYFDLVQTFTFQSKGKQSFAKLGRAMPQKEIEGRILAAAFVQATFSDDVAICKNNTARKLSAILRNRSKGYSNRTPPITFGGWPRATENDQ